MNKRKLNFKLILLLATWLVSFSAFAVNNAPQFSSPKNKIFVTPTQSQFTITLKSNPTQGYAWKVASLDKTMFENVDHQYVAPTNTLSTTSGYEVWTFHALYPKTPFAVNQVGHVFMEYKNKAKDKNPLKVYHFTVVMKKK